ncbi:hypothetical protein ACH5RR_040625 [Cinchona calisaya]|uniref:Uncharacterized protein n=1 Tax=Cinchona calisaya TaxID=153742 RepID=A0ABD2XSM9_9GENT
MVLGLATLRPKLSHIRDQILTSPDIPSLDDLSSQLLQCYKLHGRPPRAADIVQTSLSGSKSDTSEGQNSLSSVFPSGSELDKYLKFKANIQSSSSHVAFVAQSGNSSVACLTRSSSWIVDSDASDHISGPPLVSSNPPLKSSNLPAPSVSPHPLQVYHRRPRPQPPPNPSASTTDIPYNSPLHQNQSASQAPMASEFMACITFAIQQSAKGSLRMTPHQSD